MHAIRRWCLAAGMGAVIVSLAACGGNDNKGASPVPTAGGGAATAPAASAPAATAPAAGGATTANAEAVFKANCVACHGDNLDGRGAANKNLQKVGAKYNKEKIAGIIINGQNGMPAFKGRLKDDEINALADWLAAKK
jgi:cytochrome c551